MNKKMLFLAFLFWGTCVVSNAQNIAFDDIFNNKSLRPKSANIGQFSNDGKFLISTKTAKTGDKNTWWVILQNPANPSDSIKTLFHSNWFEKILPEGSTTFSSDEKFMLVETNPQKIYRHSSSVNAYVVDIQNKKIIDIPGRFRYPTLSPNNKNVAYVKDNNMFIFDLTTGKENQITTDGKNNEIINGAVDWVYEEEFSMSVGFQWSPSGNFLAFYRFDESKVKEFSMDIFQGLYPSQEKWKYPKAGEANSQVDVFIYDLAKNKKIAANVESQRDQYIPRIQWTQTDNQLSIQRLNRLQNHWELLFCNPANGNCKLVLEEKDPAYVDINDNLMFLPNTSQLLYTSEKSGFNHLYLFDYVTNKSNQVTSGNWQINRICGFNAITNTVYYTSTEFSTIQDNLWKVSITTKKRSMFSSISGNTSVIMSSNAAWYYVIQSNFSVNPISKTTLIDGSKEISIKSPTKLVDLFGSSQVITIEDNAAWSIYLAKMNLGQCTFGQLKNTDGVSLNYWMIKPYNFDSTKKYPVLMYM